MTTYNIDRNTASRLLNLSVRTVDRYLKSGKLSSIKADGRIWLSKEEILTLLRAKQTDKQPYRQPRQRQYVEPDIIVENSDSLSKPNNRQEYNQANNSNNYAQRTEPETAQNSKTDLNLGKLYEEMKQSLAIRDKRLAQASYKIGQLEAQMSTMLPRGDVEKEQKLLAAKIEDYEQKLFEKDNEFEELRIGFKEELTKLEEEKEELNIIRIEELGQKDQMIRKLDEDLHLERVNKWIHAAILYVFVIALITIWLIIRFL